MDDLPAPSSLLSSRWSRDSLLTGHPAQLYDGAVLEHVDEDALEHLIRDLERTKGPLHVGAGRMGVFTWDIACTGADGAFTLQVPLVLDEPGTRGRAKRDVPAQNVANLRDFIARGLTRFAVEPIDLTVLAGNVPAALFAALPDHRPISFGRGGLHVEIADGKHAWLVALGPGATADLLAEMIAALVYHYDPDAAGGTAITDVCINDGDFVVKRRRDGTFDVRLTAARHRERGIGPSLLLLYLIQMMAYEDWSIDGKLVGPPDAGLQSVGRLRGPRARPARPLPRSGSERKRGRRAGAALDPRLRPLARGPRLSPVGRAVPRRTSAAVVRRRPARALVAPRPTEDEARRAGAVRAARIRRPARRASVRALRSFIDRLSREIGRRPDDDGGAARVNDLGRDDLLRLLEDAQVATEARDGVAGELFAHWPYRGLDHLVAQVPAARGLRRLKSRVTFGRVVSDVDQGTLASLGPAPIAGRAARPVANPEAFGGPTLPAALHEQAVRTFPTFEAYMDAALHDPRWGYYAGRVSIGRGGHFITNPESLSPRYGGWIAERAFRCWRDMVAHGELAETDAFPIVEFGAGNGRLARDIIDAATRGADGRESAHDGDERKTFASRLAYRIYETSASLRDRQQALLGKRRGRRRR